MAFQWFTKEDSPADPVAAYDALIRPLEPQMMRTIWRITQNADDAEDAMQEALAILWRKFPRIVAHQNPRALVLRICLNAASDVMRKRTRVARSEVQTEWYAEVDQKLPEHGGTVLDRLEAEDLEREVVRALAQLSPQQGEAVRLRLLKQESYEAIAAALACSEATARTHVARGRARLQELLAHWAPQKLAEGGATS
ncbi:MAG: RNA polymerase sigma factor [Candidatus Sumerlaeia bacterium]|nr:RNA polymerase sigma factor [Candidatus Sumerlaeia bacterium]